MRNLVERVRSWFRRCQMCGARHAWENPIQDYPAYESLCKQHVAEVLARLVAAGPTRMEVKR